MDVLVRAMNSVLFLSHGIRKDCSITLHLLGGPGPPRRIRFDGANIRGVHPDERALAGQISKILIEPTPAIGHWVELHPGIFHSGGNITQTIKEWGIDGVIMTHLDADAASFSPSEIGKESSPLGFFLSDDQPFSEDEQELLKSKMESRSIGKTWVQGHIAIGIIHFILDEASRTT